MMKAMILAAGCGARLKPITDESPKALIPIDGKPMIEHLILKLKASGFSHLVINVHHFAEQIIDFILLNGSFDIKIEFSDERDYLRDTGGAIKQAATLLGGDSPFLVHNVDILSNVDLKRMYDTHLQGDALSTLLVSHRRTSRHLFFDKNNHLCGWRNKESSEVKSFYPNFDPSDYQEYAFGGIHVISPEIFQYMEDWTGKFSIIDFYLSISMKHTIAPYIVDGLQIMDIGKPETLKEAEQWIKEKKFCHLI